MNLCGTTLTMLKTPQLVAQTTLSFYQLWVWDQVQSEACGSFEFEQLSELALVEFWI